MAAGEIEFEGVRLPAEHQPAGEHGTDFVEIGSTGINVRGVF